MRAIRVGGASVLIGLLAAMAQANIATFEEFGGSPWQLPAESYYAGQDNAGGFNSGGAVFSNSYTDFGAFFIWSGWAASNLTDNTTPGVGNQFSAITGGGAGGSTFYGVAFGGGAPPATITIRDDETPVSMQVTNTTYAALSMADGDPFAKKFGGSTGNDPDFFKLIITGRDDDGAPIGSIDFYLADYRFENNDLDYIVNTWTTIDLTPLAGARSLVLGFASSDNGPFGMNTPAYVAMDNFVFVPEPAAVIALLLVTAMSRRRGN